MCLVVVVPEEEKFGPQPAPPCLDSGSLTFTFHIFNKPSVAGAVLKTALHLIN